MGWIVGLLLLALVAFAVVKAWQRGGRESLRAAYNQGRSQRQIPRQHTKSHIGAAIQCLEEFQNADDEVRMHVLQALEDQGFFESIASEQLGVDHYHEILQVLRYEAGYS